MSGRDQPAGRTDGASHIMKDTVLARPNLKIILLAALLVAGLKDVITNGHSQASTVRKPERG